MSDAVSNLNEKQREAVLETEGPVLVLAGAGSGKTRVLTHRIAYILETGKAKPEEILAVTFTNKAAAEMKERLEELAGSKVKSTAIGTFHSLGARLLREQVNYLNRGAGFTIIDTSDSERLIKQAMDGLRISTKEWTARKLRSVVSKIKHGQGVTDRIKEMAERVTYEYEKLLVVNNSYDFDDLILEPLKLLQTEEKVRNLYQERWKYLSVDEYQDTNPHQDAWLKLQLNDKQNLCAVGDDYQAIYSWRGAKVDHILDFEQSFPNGKIVYLTQNYRSSAPILTAANQVIAGNEKQKHKELWTEETAGKLVRCATHETDRREAVWVRQEIEDFKAAGGKLNECAILFRTNAQSRVLEEEFLRNDMPYVIVGGMRFYDRAEVKDVLAWLELLVNPNQQLAVRRLINSLAYGVGPAAIKKARAVADEVKKDLMEVLVEGAGLSDRQRTAMRPITNTWKMLQKLKPENPAKILETAAQESGYLKYLESLPDGEERAENIGELLAVAGEYDKYEEMVEAVSLLTNMDSGNLNQDRVWCLTLHAAKGLEWPKVFVVGCEEGLLPHKNSWGSQAELEEERRLLYVGMTRARKELSLSWSKQRNVYGDLTSQSPSRFLEELPEEAIEKIESGWGESLTDSGDLPSIQIDGELINFRLPNV